jgi:hypothetical protein
MIRMEKEELIKFAKQIASYKESAPTVLAEASEFLRIYAGEKSSFYKQLKEIKQSWDDDYIINFTRETLNGFIRFYESGLDDGISIERRAQIDVVSDFLEQADKLLNTNNIHPATPCVLIGASLEEFLRNWVEEQNLNIGQNKLSIDTYIKVLKEVDLITKQDYKDITAWAGLRNHAAHGEWEEVSDRKRISLMLEGVNLFMRKYSK